MWTSKLFWKLFVVIGGLVLLQTVVFLTLLNDATLHTLIDQSLHQQERLATHLANVPESSNPDQLRADLIQRIDAAAPQLHQTIRLLDDQGKLLHGEPERESGYADRPELEEASRGELGSHWKLTSQDIPITYTAVPVRSRGKTVAFVHLTQTLGELRDQVASYQRRMWLYAWGIATIAVVGAYLLVSRIVRPLTQLTVGAQALAANENQMLSFESLDELGVLGAAFNQMQRKLAGRVQQLRDNTERLETILGSMAEGVLAVSPDGIVLLANEASRGLLEIDEKNPIGRPLLDVTRAFSLHSLVAEALQSAQPVSKEFESNGIMRRVLFMRALRMPGDPCPGVLLVLHDVSDLRRLENLRREFVANVSHELKTPLSAIKAYAETLKLGAVNDPENCMNFIGRIEEQADRLHQLIQDLLQIARVESGQEAFDMVDVDLREAIMDCIDQYLELAATKKIDLTAIGPDESIVVNADEEGIRTILSNLIDNAIKYTPSGGKVTVRWQSGDAFALLEVEDTGIGIAPKDQARVFERFYRVDKARSREMGGTGLGLSIVKHLAQAFGGTVGIESQPKVGTTFIVRLPIYRRYFATSTATPATSS